ncbi:MAG: DbpA RNA binding domain-containing protein, partial [Verrucomicrobiaceae bacterium]|nr:DbpA RNA binding domain-containing protein [Verrucomicrobiaceae bacterium]
ALQEAIVAGGLDHFRVAVESLAQEHDLMNIALAAVKLLHQSSGGDREDVEEGEARPAARESRQREPRDAREPREARGRKDSRGPHGKMSRIYVAAGSEAGILPQNLVGAITGESGIRGNQIGAIEISERYSIVELEEAVIEDVLQAMRKALIKGKRVMMRRFVEKT